MHGITGDSDSAGRISFSQSPEWCHLIGSWSSYEGVMPFDINFLQFKNASYTSKCFQRAKHMHEKLASARY